MDYLQLAGKNILVLGLANRKSVAWHAGCAAARSRGPRALVGPLGGTPRQR